MKKKKIIFLISLLTVVLTITSIFIYSKKLEITYEPSVEILVNQEIYNIDNIKVKNGKIITDKEKIDTSKPSKKTINFQIKDFFNKTKDFSYELTIKDTEKPIITYNKLIEIEENEQIDLLKNVTVTDNTKEKITPIIEGEYNTAQKGEYKLYYIAKDSSGNIAKEEFTLKVNEKKKSPTETPRQNNITKNATNTTNNNTTPKNNTNSQNQTFTTSKGFKGTTKNGITYIDGYLVVNKTYPLPSTYGNGLTKETLNNFNKMKSAATLEGLNIYLSSGFRSYNTQNNLYNKYVKRDGKKMADTYSARPGYSEHQSGLAFDVNTINDSFTNTPEAKWLANNCYKYGFILRYPKNKSNETGYKYESWHFRYVGEDLAKKLYNNGNWITMEKYFGITSEYTN